MYQMLLNRRKMDLLKLIFCVILLEGPSASGGPVDNNGGCPQLRNDCNFDCLTINALGCIECTCTGSPQSSGLSGGSTLTSSGNSSSAGNQPPIAGSPFAVSMSGTNSNPDSGTSSYQNPGSNNNQNSGTGSYPDSGTSNIQNSGTGSSQAVGTSSSSTGGQHGGSNLAGCPRLSKDCNYDCLIVQANGCIACNCEGISGPAGNNNGCPPFPTNCRSDCLSLSSFGCPLCACTTGTEGYNAQGSNSSVHQNNNNNNNCPPFSSSCPAKCTSTSNGGCPVCTCDIPGTGDKQECPPVVPFCNRACLYTDDAGCILCNGDCNSKYSNSQQTNPTSSPTIAPPASTTRSMITCPVFDGAKCDPSCLGLDGNGCLSCDCGSSAGNSGSLSSSASVIPISGTGTSVNGGQPGTSSLTGTGCPDFDVSCPTGCPSVDEKGCLQCTCKATPTITTPGPFARSTSSLGLVGNANNCPAFDTSCPGNCAKVNAMGCLTCSCSVVHQEASTTSSPSPVNVKSCPTFDMTCPANCAIVDKTGCLACPCNDGPTSPVPDSITQMSTLPSSTVTPSIPTTTADPCPIFDEMYCDQSCIGLDDSGCLICTCNMQASTKQARQTTPTPPTSKVHITEKCAPFDKLCPAGCAALDTKGCLLCACSARTTSKPPQTTTTTPTPTQQHASSRTPVTMTTDHMTPPPPFNTTEETCPPVRCIAPCDLGIKLGPDNCPICKCRATTLTSVFRGQ